MKRFNVFVDWGKEHTVLIGDSKSVKAMNNDDLLNLPISNIYLETGSRRMYWLLHQLFQKRHRIFVIDGKLVKKVRDKMNRKKTDILDVSIIRAYALKKPELFKQITKKEDSELRLQYLMDKYNSLMKDCAKFKNIKYAFEKKYGKSEVHDNLIKTLESEKQKVLKQVEPLIKNELELVEGIKGVGLRLLAGLLSVADPRRFSSLRDYLNYCGYRDRFYYKNPKKGYVKGNFRRHYNGQAHTVTWQIVEGLIMHKDLNYYPFYLKVKRDLTSKHPTYRKCEINSMAINRIATFLLKDIYDRVNNRRITFPEEIKNPKVKVSCNGREMTVREMIEEMNKNIKPSPPHTLVINGQVRWMKT